MQLYVDSPEGTSKPYGKFLQMEIVINGQRHVTVSPDHPRLYQVALEAEQKGDRLLQRAVADAARKATR